MRPRVAFFRVSCYTFAHGGLRRNSDREAFAPVQKSYALFDFDGTLLKGDSIVRFCFFARRQGLCSLAHLRGGARAALGYKLGLSSARQSKASALSQLCCW